MNAGESARIGELPKGKVGPLAQLVEQRTFNPWVDGSSPSGPTYILIACDLSCCIVCSVKLNCVWLEIRFVYGTWQLVRSSAEPGISENWPIAGGLHLEATARQNSVTHMKKTNTDARWENERTS